MPDLVKVKIGDTELLMETSQPDGKLGYREVSVQGKIEKAITGFSDFLEPMNALYGEIVKSFEKMSDENKPNKITTEFGFGLNAQGDVYIVKTGCNASIKITAVKEYGNR